MLFIGNLLRAIGAVGALIANLYIFFIVIAAFISWFVSFPVHPLVRILYEITDPPLRWIRRRFPVVYGGIDFSPIIIIIIVYFIKYTVFDTIYNYGVLLVQRALVGG